MTKTTPPAVSVIIPAYNSEKYLSKAIESVLAQTCPAVECIVVDDGSLDGTGRIAQSYPEVTYIRQENSERSAARNNGLRHASGRYLSFLDADDAIAPEKIAAQLEFLERNADCQAVYSKVLFFRDQSPEALFPLERITPAGDLLEKLLYGNFITIHAPLIRKAAVDAIGGFDVSLSQNEDWDFFLRLALYGRFGFIDEFHAYCRMHAANTSRDEIGMHESKWQVARRFLDAHRQELRQKGIDPEPVSAYHQADLGKALIANGRGAEGRRQILSAARQRFSGRGKYLAYALLSCLLGPKLCARLGGGAYRDPGGRQ